MALDAAVSGPPAAEVAVVLPVYRHSLLATEAIAAVLSQDLTPAPVIYVVNDGCPFPATHRVLSALARRHPERIRYLRKPNGGLSSARNHGIEAALAEGPDLRAVYFLDADNRLEPWALRRFFETLTEAGADWAYPDITRFGVRGGERYDGAYRVSTHLSRNICEAGSMVCADMLRAGLRFDETMRDGYEDWDFWLSAAEHGYRGVHVPASGFLYRRRPASMLSGSHELDTALRSTLRRKHAGLYDPRVVRQLCHAEAPELALIDLAADSVRLCSDPLVPARQMDLEAFCQLMQRHAADPAKYTGPQHLIFAQGAFAPLFEDPQAGPIPPALLRSVLWRLINGYDGRPFSTLSLDRAAPEAGAAPGFGPARGLPAGHETTAPDPVAPDLVSLRGKLATEVMRDPKTGWLETILADPAPQQTHRSLTTGTPPPAAQPAVRPGLLPAAAAFLLGPLRKNGLPEAVAHGANWRSTDADTRLLDRSGGTLPAGTAGFPRLPDARPAIAFVLPILDFGGVEKVTLRVAEAFRAAGWHVALCVLGAEGTRLPLSDLPADDVILIGDVGAQEWSGAAQYFGHPYPKTGSAGAIGRVLSALLGFDCVVNCHSWTLNAAMQELRRQGIVTLSYQHLLDESPWGRAVGHVPVAQAFEHCYDAFATCSDGLARQLTALGIPPDKIIPVPNAPGYGTESLPEALQASAPPARAMAGRAPRVLFLGRLDRQKGLARLSQLHARTRAVCTWRLIGKTVLEGGRPHSGLPEPEPPIYTAEGLEEAYRWADFVLLLSDYEGLPLTVLEAMRAGAIPICTDVGATREVIRHGETGFLLPLAGAVDAAEALLQEAASDPARFAAISAAAQAAMAERTWARQAAPLLQHITPLVRARRRRLDENGSVTPL